MPTVARALGKAESALGAEGRIDAEILLAHVLVRPRSWLYAHAQDALEEELLQRFFDLVKRRKNGQPIAQITAHREFWSLDLLVTKDTLIPRPETELLVELALTHLSQTEVSSVLDLGTGTGAIALAIAKERPQAIVAGVDADFSALEVARANAVAHTLTQIQFFHSDWFSGLPNRYFDLIVSNPPYIAEGDPHLKQGDLRFEPHHALASGTDGLDAIRQIVHDAPVHLVKHGWLLIEHGYDQGEVVRRLFSAAGFTGIQTMRDLENRERVTLGSYNAADS